MLKKNASISQEQIKNSDIKAFESLFRAYYAQLCHFAFGFVKDMDTAEEIVQDFFYNYWKNRESISFQTSTKAYLYQAIKNNSLKYLDKVSVRRRYASEVMANTSEENLSSLSDELDGRELEKTINETLKELPERCSQIFLMSRFEGLKYHEIADKLSISVKTVEANMSKALQAFREKLNTGRKNSQR